MQRTSGQRALQAPNSEGEERHQQGRGQGEADEGRQAAEDSAARKADAASPPRAAGRQQPGKTVLVVDDEAAVRSLVVEVLTELGCEVVEAADGANGISALRRVGTVDLLVTDVGLPGLNGRQLADQARLTRPDLRVLFITGYAENAALASGFLEPGMEMITKPFPVDALASRIRQMIEG